MSKDDSAKAIHEVWHSLHEAASKSSKPGTKAVYQEMYRRMMAEQFEARSKKASPETTEETND